MTINLLRGHCTLKPWRNDDHKTALRMSEKLGVMTQVYRVSATQDTETGGSLEFRS